MRALLFPTLLVVALIAPAAATGCEPTTTDPDVCWDLAGICTSGDLAGAFYVNLDPCFQDECISIWFYAETNGIPGLQRGDEVVDDTCGGQIDADTMVF